jgi:hypothetical protein
MRPQNKQHAASINYCSINNAYQQPAYPILSSDVQTISASVKPNINMCVAKAVAAAL